MQQEPLGERLGTTALPVEVDGGPAGEAPGASGGSPALRFALLMIALSVLAFASWVALRAVFEDPPAAVMAEAAACRAEHCPIDAPAVPSLRPAPDAP